MYWIQSKTKLFLKIVHQNGEGVDHVSELLLFQLWPLSTHLLPFCQVCGSIFGLNIIHQKWLKYKVLDLIVSFNKKV